MNKYILVTFPEIQEYMTHERWDECIFVNDDNVPDSSYMVPEDLYNEVNNKVMNHYIKVDINDVDYADEINQISEEPIKIF